MLNLLAIDLTVFENLGAEIVAFLAGSSIITSGIVIVREIGVASLRRALGKKEVEIDELNKTITKQDGQIQEMRKSQAAVVEGMNIIGNMVNKAYMNSKLDDNTKTEIAIMHGELDKVAKAAMIVGVEAVFDKIESGAQAIIEQLPEGAAQDAAGFIMDKVEETAENLVETVPEYLKDVVIGQDSD